MRTPVTKRLPSLRSAKRVKQECVFSLPDDLLILILIRLSLEDVLGCRCVCSRWRDLTSTEYFVHTHRPRNAPVIFATAFRYNTKHHERFLLEKWWEQGPKESMVCSLNHNQICFSLQWAHQCSGDGLLAFKFYDPFFTNRKFVIFNSYGKKGLAVVLPERLFSITEAFAIYFHPTVKEYCILWKVHPDPDEGGTRYMILNLGPKPCWKRISNPWTHNFKNPVSPTLLIDRQLYWLVQHKEDDEHNGYFVIMEFDIVSQELMVMLSPIPADVKYNGYNNDLPSNPNMNLLDVGGQLSLFLISPREGRVYQWTLESREQELWTRCTYNISYNDYGFEPLRPVALVEQHLLVTSLTRDLPYSFTTVVNLKLGTARKLRTDFHTHCSMSFSYVRSLAYRRNCKSKIVIEENENNRSVSKRKFRRTPPEEKSWKYWRV